MTTDLSASALTAPAAQRAESRLPVPYRVIAHWPETPDTITLRLDPVAESLPDFVPGQFAMVHCFGRGEIPVSVSSVPTTGGLAHTVRAVGAVSEGLCAARVGDVLGLRGPYGTGWELERALGQDVLVVAGGAWAWLASGPAAEAAQRARLQMRTRLLRITAEIALATAPL